MTCKEAIRQRYATDHVFRSLVDVLASHFRINLGYSKAEVLDAVAAAEIVVKEHHGQQYIEVTHDAGVNDAAIA